MILFLCTISFLRQTEITALSHHVAANRRRGYAEYTKLVLFPWISKSTTQSSRWKVASSASSEFDPQIDDVSFLYSLANHTTNYTKIAVELRRRARELRLEVQEMEKALEKLQSSRRKERESEQDSMLKRLFPKLEPSNPETVAKILREERWSVNQVETTLQLLLKHKNQVATTNLASQRQSNPSNATITPPNTSDLQKIDSYIHCIIDAAAILDKEFASEASERQRLQSARWSGRGEQVLRSVINQWQKTNEADLKRAMTTSLYSVLGNNSAWQSYGAQDLGVKTSDINNKTLNETRMVETNVVVPHWVPSSLGKLIHASQSKLAVEDVQHIKDSVLPASRFYCTSYHSTPFVAIYRGNIRYLGTDVSADSNSSPAVVFSEIQKLVERETMSSRVQLFLMPDPEWRPNRDPREPSPKPVILAISKNVVPDGNPSSQKAKTGLAKKLLPLLTAATSFMFSVQCFALNGGFFNAVVMQQDESALLKCLPIGLGVLVLQGVHELGHIIASRVRKIKVGAPIPIPSIGIGTFGCITCLRSFPKNRAALLDFALSGPMSGLFISLLLMIIGIRRTVRAPYEVLSRFPVVPLATLKSSFLSGSILTYFAPKAVMLPLSQPIPVHPLYMIGFSGLVASALNLLPIFRLDGGRACFAAMGSRFGGIASAWTLLFLLSTSLSGTSNLSWLWCMFILFFQRQPEIPARDDVTDIDDARLWIWITSIAFCILTLLPFPGAPGLL